ncbi:MAG TPA: ABC transporter permease [Verrucomicrobiae bacterium]|nr:ABC transporter permease [Verrucomicrobiae bacterium]
MWTLLQDAKYGVRMLAKNPGFTAVAVLTLALGIGANSTIFSWINATLLNPLPGATRTSELYTLTSGGTAQSPHVFSYQDYLDLRSRTKTMSGILASSLWPMDLTGTGKPERIWGTLVSENFFDVLGARPVLGRGFLPEEGRKPEGAPVAVISYRLWQMKFGGDPKIVGKEISINRHPFQVVGVMGAEFKGNQTGLRSEIWLPLVMVNDISEYSGLLENRDSRWLILMGRIAPGAQPPQARQELDVLMGQIARQFPDSHTETIHCGVYPLWRAPASANAYFHVLLPMLMAIAGVVLLLACANVANLLLVRSVARRREMAIRLSLGASRGRLVRQLMAESVMLALAGGALAMLITLWTAGSFARFIPPAGIPVSLDVTVDRAVLGATLGFALATAVLFGILPALRSSRLAPVDVLKEESGTASGNIRKAKLSTALVVAQVSMSLLLLICAGLIVRGFREQQKVNPGFNANHMLLETFNLFSSGYTDEQGIAFERELRERLETLPGVKSAALASWVPLGFSYSARKVAPEGYVPQPHEDMTVGVAAVSPGYFRTMEIAMIGGREFSDEDRMKAQPAAIVNRAFAERYWPGQSAVGKGVEVEGKTWTVVGVAENSDYDNLNETPQPFFYMPLLQDYYSMAAVHVRTDGDPLAEVSAVEKTIHEMNPEVPVYDVMTLASRVELASTNERIAGTFVGAFGILALVLAAVGIYGVVAYVTRQRTHEIGIRMALGAQRRDVLHLVMDHGLKLTVMGLALGLGLSLLLTRYISSVIFTVSPTDPWVFAGVTLLLCGVALGACYVPARRAMRVDPMVALRYE